ncbi:DUF5634 family protein [Geomonas sp. RF6]|uniref:PilZ-like domain-containing protein n=1 Tax=Geomonas sp. RF6 TaxID=2897342 RepID=UPI001E44C355|nr:PilZ-like domain-containing protein [Geomonas sp. RF6]UFS71496.1 DUF5634 family protein [Geomonas sp. RF6]
MRDDYAEYASYLHTGLRVEIGIPLAGGGVFRDWAIINDYHEDEVVAQISRDVLPANVRVEVGSILDLSVWVEKDAYTCSCIVTEKESARTFRIRLFGTFNLQERRQFFRLQMDLRARFAAVEEQDRDLVKTDWERRKELEHMKLQGYDRFVIAAHQAQFPPALELDWREIPSPSSNVGGGGIRLRLPRRVRPEELLNLEIHLPVHPPRLIYAVAEVMHIMEPRVVKGKTEYPAGLKFLHLDERDRDLIFQQISVRQIEHLRKLADARSMQEPVTSAEPERRGQRMLRSTLLALVVLILSFCLVRFLIRYNETGPQNPIGTTYEKSIKQYRGVRDSSAVR